MDNKKQKEEKMTKDEALSKLNSIKQSNKYNCFTLITYVNKKIMKNMNCILITC